MSTGVDREPGGGQGAVFISYSREDREFVHRLRDALSERGHRCWVDEQGIRPTAAWMDEVRAAIEAAPAFVFVASPRSAGSEVCREEVSHAERVSKRILPVVCAETAAEALPESIASRHWVSMRAEDEFERGVEELAGALDTDPEWAAEHTRFLRRAVEWDKGGRDASLALRGRDLVAAERWLSEADERKDPQPARLHTEYIFACRRAATRGQRLRMALLGAGLLIAAALAIYASIQKGQADDRAREARSRELAAKALLNLRSDPEVGLLFAVEAARTADTPEAELAMRRLLPESHASGVLSAGPADVNSAVISPDGRLAATADDDGVVRIWVVRSGRVLHRLAVSSGRATDVAFNRDGTLLLTAAVAGSVDLWTVGSGKRIRDFPGLGGVIESADFSPDGSLVVAGGTEGARVWTAGGQALSSAERSPEALWGVDFSPDGRWVASAGADGAVRVWNARTGNPRRLLAVGGGPGADSRIAVYSAKFSPDGGHLLTSSEDGVARIWSLADGRVMTVLPASANRIYDASFSPDRRRVVTGSPDGEARVWSLDQLVPGPAGSPPQARLLTVLHAPGGQVLSASFGADRQTVITGESGGAARIWSTAGYDRVTEFADPGHQVLGAGFSPDGRRVVTSNADSTARIWNPRSGKTIAYIGGHSAAVWSAEFSSDGSRVVTGGNDGSARIWDVDRGQAVAVLDGGSGAAVYAAAFSPDGRRVATADGDGVLRIWSADGDRLSQFHADRDYLSDAAFSPDGRILVTAGQRGAALWDDSGDRLHTLRGPDGGAVFSASFRPDGDVVATAGADQTVRIWDVASGRQLEVLRDSPDALLSVAFGRGGEIAAAGRDRAVRIWDSGSGQLLDTIRGPRSYVNAVAFGPDGRSILAASYDGSAYVMRCGLCVPTARIEAIAAARIESSLTTRERARYRNEADSG